METFKEGEPVLVHRDNGETLRTVTRSESFIAASGDEVVFVRGISGYYCVSHTPPNKVTRSRDGNEQRIRAC